ncbi:MAG: UvrD-helicase domain-containing protein [Bacteroidales bacterium]
MMTPPFIYEKISSTYDHYIIDEFRIHSRIQWNNFRPLISETLSRAGNLVVGDVKQSIYRWRNSDWRIIHTEAAQALAKMLSRVIRLSTNFRSRTNIIRFNNSFFAPGSIPSLCDEKLAFNGLRISDVYAGSEQQGTPEKDGGFVKLTLYRKSDDEGWKERVLKDLPELIEGIQDHGYRADEILFLCRTNEEGKSIISRILEYSASLPPEHRLRYNYEITSGESCSGHQPGRNLHDCLPALHLTDPGSRINMSQMVKVIRSGHRQG